MRVRLAPLGAGLAALVVGAVLTAAGEVLPAKYLQNLALIAAGILVAGVAVFGVLVRALEGDGRTALPGPEFGPGVRTPGDETDERLAEVTGRHDGTRVDLGQRFADAAAATLARRDGTTRSAARERLAAGTWTDDAEAAAFFADDADDGTSVREWLRTLLGGETTYQQRAKRATRALLDGEDR